MPWWLTHHKQYFDHGIMIDYASTDCSQKIIQEICPEWEIIDSKNKFFHPEEIDREVESFERNLDGWRVCLTVPEFLVGNYARLSDATQPTNIYVDQIIFVEPHSKESPSIFDKNRSIIDQCHFGMLGLRSVRSIHNYPVNYPNGRHYNFKETYQDLKIYYYGWSSLCQESIQRRMQIQQRVDFMSDSLCPHFLLKMSF